MTAYRCHGCGKVFNEDSEVLAAHKRLHGLVTQLDKLGELQETAASLMASQQAMPDDGALDMLRGIVREAAGLDGYTREEVTSALNDAADLMQELLNPEDIETSDTVRNDDTVNLIVNLTGYLLDHPDGTLNEAIAAMYTDVEPGDWELDDGEEMPEKGSQRWNELVVKHIRSWF